MQHTVKAYDDELDRLHGLAARMAELATTLLSEAVDALVRGDIGRAAELVEADREIDAAEIEAEDLVVQMIARRSPVADDLREIIAVLKITAMLERVGDFAKNIAKRVPVIARAQPVRTHGAIARMAGETKEMIGKVMRAWQERDREAAIEVWRSDDAVDALYDSLFRELLTHMMENPASITAATHLLFVAKNIERIGDQATNIAEVVHYALSGERLDDDRPKADSTALADVGPQRDI